MLRAGAHGGQRKCSYRWLWGGWIQCWESNLGSQPPSHPFSTKESLCCTPSKISQPPMTNTVWFHLHGVLWGVTGTGSRWGWSQETQFQLSAMRKFCWLATQPHDWILLPQAAHMTEQGSRVFSPLPSFEKKKWLFTNHLTTLWQRLWN